MPAYKAGAISGGRYQILRDSELGDYGPGGLVLQFDAGALPLLIGDSVFLSTATSVDKSVTPADHASRIGIVVGGSNVYDSIIDDIGIVGTTAAFAGKKVLVLVQGVAYVVCDAAIAVRSRIAPSTTVAGRVRIAAAMALAAGAVAVTSSAANGAIVTGDSSSPVMGILLQASAAAGDKRLALITL